MRRKLSYYSAHRQPPNQEQAGFTLVELLIVVGIVLLLATFTIVAVDFTFDSERVRSASRQVQSMLEGARDRAIHAREPRGVRFLVDVDPDNGRMVSSMIYIGASEPWTQGQITLKRPDFVNNTGAPISNNILDAIDYDGDGIPSETEIFLVEGTPETLWYNLKQRGFLGIYEDRNNNGVLDSGEDENGNGFLDRDAPRIKIPGDRNGTWYNVLTHWLGKDPNIPNRLQLISPYRDPGTTPTDQVIAFEGTGPNTYILELPPRILPDAEPVLLPNDVVIDLDGSLVPRYWRPSDTNAGLSTAYSAHMDVMFSPRGTVTGAAAAQGLIHLYISRRQDVFRITTAVPPSTPPLRAAVNAADAPVVPGNSPIAVDGKPVGDRALVTIFTSTGKIASHPLNMSSVSGNTLSDPFLFAEKGQVTSQ